MVWKDLVKTKYSIGAIRNVVIVAVIDWNLKTSSIMMLAKGTDSINEDSSPIDRRTDFSISSISQSVSANCRTHTKWIFKSIWPYLKIIWPYLKIIILSSDVRGNLFKNHAWWFKGILRIRSYWCSRRWGPRIYDQRHEYHVRKYWNRMCLCRFSPLG